MTELLFTGEQLGRLALQFLLAGAGTLSFAILFACPRRTLPYCGLVGAVGWLVYEIAELFGMEAFAASLLAVIPLTLLARILAMTLRTPVTVFLLTGIFPLVPGAGIYYSAYYFIQGDNALALANGISTFTFVVRSSRTRSFSSMMHAMYQLNSFATLPMTVLSALLPASPSSSARTSLTVSCSTSSMSTAFS